MRDRIIGLVVEVAGMYAARGVRGIELDFQRGLEYFPSTVPTADRRTIMHSFLRDIRAGLDEAARHAGVDDIALGLRLTPKWATLQTQGLDEIATLVATPVNGGDGITCAFVFLCVFCFALSCSSCRRVNDFSTHTHTHTHTTHGHFDTRLRVQHTALVHSSIASLSSKPTHADLNWGIFFYAYQPFDSELASLAAATPKGTPFYYETSSWVGTGPPVASCHDAPKVRITKEELYTTALLARSYGARGISAWNFIYTRPYCE